MTSTTICQYHFITSNRVCYAWVNDKILLWLHLNNQIYHLFRKFPHPKVTYSEFLVPKTLHLFFLLLYRNREHLSQHHDTTAEKYPTEEAVLNSIVTLPNPNKLRYGIWASESTFVGSINFTPDKNNPHFAKTMAIPNPTPKYTKITLPLKRSWWSSLL